MVLLEFSMSPLGKGESVGKYVSRSLDLIDKSGVDYRLNPMGTVLEGEWEPGRLVMLEFPSVERAIAWYESAEYATARELRRTSARMDMVLVEGLGG